MLPIEYHAGIDALTDRGVVRLGGDEVTIEQPDQQMTYRNPRGFSPHARGTEVFVEAVRAGDAASLAAAEALIADAAAGGRFVDEAGWTIGLARWLPEGDADRVRLMAGARHQIGERGLGGFVRFLDT